MPHGSVTWLGDAPPIADASTNVVRRFAVVDDEPGAMRYSNYTSGVLECEGRAERPPSGAPSVEIMKRSRRAPEGAAEYWLGWGAWGEHPEFELTNGQTFDTTSAIILCQAEDAFVVCLTNTQWDGEPGASDRLADALAMPAMDAIVPGCLSSFEVAKAAYEAREAEAQTSRRRTPPSIRSEAGRVTSTSEAEFWRPRSK